MGNTPFKADILGLPPWGYLDEQGNMRGVMYDITQKISQESGIALETRLYPVKRLVQRLQANQSQLSIILLSDWSRENLIPIAPIFTDVRSIILPRAAITINDFDDLAYLRLAMIRGTKIGLQIKGLDKLNKIMTNDYLQSAHLLKAGRVDAIVGVEPSLYWVTRKAGLSWEEMGRPFVLLSSAIWLHVTKNSFNDAQIEKLKLTVRKLKKTRYFEEVMYRYLYNQ